MSAGLPLLEELTLFSIPTDYLNLDDWESYRARVDATLLAMIIALLTVSSQAYQAANSNPVDALKYE